MRPFMNERNISSSANDFSEAVSLLNEAKTALK